MKYLVWTLFLLSSAACGFTNDSTSAHWCLIDKNGQVPSGCTGPALTSENVDVYKAFYPSTTLQRTWNHQKRIVPLFSLSTSQLPSNFMRDDDAETLGYIYKNSILFHWQDISKIVFFGGSEAEGQLLLPTPGWIKTAHQNGASVYGTIMFAPDVYGGYQETEQLRYFLTPDSNGQYPVADLMLQIAKQYGIDGFFLNEEASYPDGFSVNNFASFITYFNQEAAKEKIKCRVEWYTVFDNDSTNVLFQNNQMVSDSTFVDYGLWSGNWVTDPVTTAITDGFPKDDVELGLLTTTYGLDSASNLNVSASEFAFQNVINGGGDHNTSPAQQFQNAQSFWQTAETYYPPSNIQKITGSIFETHFNMGVGNTFFVNGTDMKTGYWNAIGLQDVLPAFSSMAQIDYDTAYNGGSSVDVNVPANTQTSTIDLYNNMSLNIDRQTVLTVIYQQNKGSQNLSLCLEGKSVLCLPLANPNKTIQGWQFKTIPVPSNTYTGIDIQIPKNNTDQIEYHLGEIFIGNANDESSNNNQPTDVTVTKTEVDPNNTSYIHKQLTWKSQQPQTYLISVGNTLKSVSFEPAADIVLSTEELNNLICVTAVNAFGRLSQPTCEAMSR